MAEGRAGRRLRLVLALLLAASPAAAEPAVSLIDLPFKATALRGPRSELAVAVATSGLLPVARARTVAAEDGESAPVVVVWGEGGGAALTLLDGNVRATLLGAEAVEGLAASETPRGALPRSRRALAGPLSAYLTGATRAFGGEAAAGLTIRERRAVALGADPKPVPTETVTVSAGPEAAFAPFRPRALRLSGRTAFLAATVGPDAAGLALIARDPGGGGSWRVAARTPPQAGGPLKVVAVAEFGAGGPRAVTARGAEGTATLQVWTLSESGLAQAGEAPGYAAGAGDTDLADILEGERGADLALPTADRGALAVLAVKDSVAERLRVPLPAPAASGVAVLGRGAGARIVVGLADGRVAVVTPTP